MITPLVTDAGRKPWRANIIFAEVILLLAAFTPVALARIPLLALAGIALTQAGVLQQVIDPAPYPPISRLRFRALLGGITVYGGLFAINFAGWFANIMYAFIVTIGLIHLGAFWHVRQRQALPEVDA